MITSAVDSSEVNYRHEPGPFFSIAKLSGSPILQAALLTNMQKLNDTSPAFQSPSKFLRPCRSYKPVSPNLKQGILASLSLYHSGSSISSSFKTSISPSADFEVELAEGVGAGAGLTGAAGAAGEKADAGALDGAGVAAAPQGSAALGSAAGRLTGALDTGVLLAAGAWTGSGLNRSANGSGFD